MTTALLGWEIGGGQGHLHELAAIANELKKHGVESVFALQNSQIKGLTLPGKVVKAPSALFKPLDDTGNIKSYFLTDILYMFGFSDVLTLKLYLKAWENLIKIIKPSFIIADYAPGLILAAKGKIPTIVFGNGFAVPPPVEQFPPLRSPPIPDSAFKRSQLVADNIKQVTDYHAPLGCLLNGDRSFILGIPELDTYADLRNEAEYVGIYTAPFLENLGDEKGEAWAYLTDDYEGRSLIIDTFKAKSDFGNLNTVLKGKSVALHHASFAMSITCLLTGIPQIVFPKDVEKLFIAKQLVDLGVAIAMIPPFTKERLSDATDYIPQITKNARQKAKQFACWNQNFMDKVAQSCLEFIR
jgi:hypothetical protein